MAAASEFDTSAHGLPSSRCASCGRVSGTPSSGIAGAPCAATLLARGLAFVRFVEQRLVLVLRCRLRLRAGGRGFGLCGLWGLRLRFVLATPEHYVASSLAVHDKSYL